MTSRWDVDLFHIRYKRLPYIDDRAISPQIRPTAGSSSFLDRLMDLAEEHLYMYSDDLEATETKFRCFADDEQDEISYMCELL